eukprot:5293571-Prymnesium_polylepis.1
MIAEEGSDEAKEGGCAHARAAHAPAACACTHLAAPAACACMLPQRRAHGPHAGSMRIHACSRTAGARPARRLHIHACSRTACLARTFRLSPPLPPPPPPPPPPRVAAPRAHKRPPHTRPHAPIAATPMARPLPRFCSRLAGSADRSSVPSAAPAPSWPPPQTRRAAQSAVRPRPHSNSHDARMKIYSQRHALQPRPLTMPASCTHMHSDPDLSRCPPAACTRMACTRCPPAACAWPPHECVAPRRARTLERPASCMHA